MTAPIRGQQAELCVAVLLGSAAAISATRTAEQLVIVIEPRALGHAFPTGDLFRRLIASVQTEDGAWSKRTFLARRFDLRRVDGSSVKVEVADDRVGARPRPTRVVFELPASVDEQALRWSVIYERVLETPISAAADAEVWDRRTLAGGSLRSAHARQGDRCARAAAKTPSSPWRHGLLAPRRLRV